MTTFNIQICSEVKSLSAVWLKHLKVDGMNSVVTVAWFNPVLLHRYSLTITFKIVQDIIPICSYQYLV